MTQPTPTPPHLAGSHLAQLELISDVDLTDFTLKMRDGAGIKLVDSISDAQLDRTIDGASTITVTVDDDIERTIQNSGKLGRRVDVNVNGLWWTLVGVKKQGRQVTLTFEEREVNLLRYYRKFIKADRATTTRAQFVLRMIREVTETSLRYVIPELTTVEKISDVQPNEILVDQNGKALVLPQTPDEVAREQGIHYATALTVQGAPATRIQIDVANQILQTCLRMGADARVQIAAVCTGITESNLTNLVGGDRDSVGVFQQRPSQGWPATRIIPTDAAAFIQRAMSIEGQDPTVSIAMLCQSVQHSAFSDGSNYAKWVGEAEAFVSAYGTEIPASTQQQQASATAAVNNAMQTNSYSAQGQFFTRGQIRQKHQAYILTPENSWQCMQRLATEVNWRCFCVSGVIYFVSDQWLFRSKAFMTISEDTPGIDWIDYDYDEGKRQATVTVTAHLSRWSAPPGSIVTIQDMGIINGRWLVNDVQRSLYETIGVITLTKPQPVLPEPVALTSVPKTFSGGGLTQPPTPGGQRDWLPPGSLTKKQQLIVSYARSQLGVSYQWGAEQAGVAFDCSGLTQAAYDSAGIAIPHNAQEQYNLGPVVGAPDQLLPGDLVFFGTLPDGVEHVGIYIGDGAMIDAPHTGSSVRIDSSFTGWTDPPYVGATRPWQT